MIPNNFRSYTMAVALYKSAKAVALPYSLKDQLMRASSSVALNLQEGAAKPSPKERRRYYLIAFASLREVQAITDLEPESCGLLIDQADDLGAMLYRLTRAPQPEG